MLKEESCLVILWASLGCIFISYFFIFVFVLDKSAFSERNLVLSFFGRYWVVTVIKLSEPPCTNRREMPMKRIISSSTFYQYCPENL